MPMSKVERERMERLEGLTQRQDRDIKELLQKNQELERKLILEEGKNLAYRELLDRKLAGR